MESQSLEQHTDTRPIPVYIASARDESDEISLIDLWSVIVRRKAIVLVSFLLSVLLAFVYLFFAEPVYKANAYLLPPQQQNIQGLMIDYQNIENIGVNRYTPEYVYGAFLDSLKSQGLRREFFEKYKLIDHYASGESVGHINADRVFYELFNERLKVQADRENDSFVMVSFSNSDPELAAQWLNQIIEFANERTVRQLFKDVNAAIQSEIDKVRYQLDSKLKLAEQRKHDTIVTLKEALRIAKALGIRDASSFPKLPEKTQSGLTINTVQVPPYMRGVEALETEISVLEARNSDEPFIIGYRDLQERRAFLEGISIDIDGLSAVTVDTVAKKPYRTERPRKLLLIFIAAALGIMIGIFLAFVAEFQSKTRNNPRKN